MDGIIAGRQPVIEALRAGTRIERIVFLQGAQGRIMNEIRELAERRGVPVVQAGKLEFRELAVDATTQGVVAVVASKSYVGVDRILEIGRERKEEGLILVLDEIEDPQNLGALVRTAECAGVHGVIIPKHRSASVTAAAARASAGATEHVAMAEVTNIVSTLEELKKEGYWVAGLDAEGDKLYTAIDYRGRIALVVGNEGRGIRRLVKEHCDYMVKIPLYGKISSLNASVAGALVMYEAARQRHG